MLMQAKARMGVIISSSNRMVEPQLRHFAPPALGLHVTRMRMASKWGKLPSDLLGEILAAAALLADAKVDVIVFQATGVAMKMGEAIEARFMNTITEETGVAALSATQAMVEALGALALRKLVIVSPFDSATNDFERAYLEGRGFTVVTTSGLIFIPATVRQIWHRRAGLRRWLRTPAPMRTAISLADLIRH